jgi:cyclopropane-fatty-acyl-phospholipid synthase
VNGSRLRPPGPWNAALGAVLRGLRAGSLVVEMPDGTVREFHGALPGPSARVVVRDPSAARRILMGASIALAETYMDGSWDTPDLEAVLDLGLTNIAAGWADLPVVLRPAQRWWHAMRDNDPRGGAKRNIAYHYDVGNDFYRLWLDDTMSYSCACFEEGDDLVRAQVRKWDRVLELVQPGPGDHVLEIGCGWGGFAVHAAREAGCRVTGLTISEAQAELARAHVREAGLEDRVEIALRDYRDETGSYDGVVSIEMFEAVGEKWWPAYFGAVKGLLKPGHAAAMQVITIAEDRFEHYRHNPDFIQRYVFPGGMLPSPERFASAARAAGLDCREPAFLGHDYARTLAEWSRRFEAAIPEVRALGFAERFVRMWRYYLAYCRVGFEHETIDVMQLRLEA